jgi:pyruvate ferredoxin oxidoreductase beta subunit
MATLKELTKKEARFTCGHRMCPGCGAPIIFRQILLAVDEPVVVGVATGCLEVSTTIFPFTSWNTPYIHNAFENAASTISGAETAYRAFVKKGKIKDKIHFMAVGGDGASYDIGFQMISGAFERGHDMVYVCYDNGAYMNTGIQRSSATPYCADTTTSPVGRLVPGKVQKRKDLTKIFAAHNIPYVAQASPSHWKDLMDKARKAFDVEGPAFLNVISPCTLGWRCDQSETIALAKEAVSSCFWPLYEVENGKYRITYKPREKTPVADWLKKQGRFAHLFKPGNEHLLEEIQAQIDMEWEQLQKLAEL